jgi:signal transduction histidine kinase
VSDPFESDEVPEKSLEQKLVELGQQLEGLQSQLIETQRLATLGTLSAVVAHEFNNLLMPILNYCKYASDSAKSDKPDMEFIGKSLEKSHTLADRASRICHSMLDMARGGASYVAFEAQKLVDETLHVMARDPQRDGIALRVQVQPGLKIEGDMIQLEQVLLNLLINARQAMMGRGGAITIKAGDYEEGMVRIQVIDTGPGIPLKIQSRIFEPFFTTKGTAKKGESRGTGLGLHICQEIVQRHHGRIELKSEVGKGTCFSVILPGVKALAKAG